MFKNTRSWEVTILPGGHMSNESESGTNITFPSNLESAFVSKTVKIVDLINKQVQVTYSLN